MEEKTVPPDKTIDRIRLVILSRLFIVTFILGIHVYAELNAGAGLFDTPISIFSLAIIFTCTFSIIFALLLRYHGNTAVNIYIQSGADLFLITSFVYGTGGIQSIYSIFYPLVIIYTVIFLEKKGGLVIATAAAILYALLAILEYYGLINPLIVSQFTTYRLEAGYVLARVVTHILSFYFTALLSIYVVGQERKTRALLAEKQDAFARLDILYKSIVESVSTGIITVNLNGRIKSFNRTASTITGYLFNEVENHLLSEIFPDLDSYLKQQKTQTGSSSKSAHFEGIFHTLKGQELKLGASFSSLKDPQDNVIGDIIIFQDITEVMNMREALEKNRRLAFTGEVAANLAHEIRNPLAAIGGSVQLLRQDILLDHGNHKLFDIILRGKEQLEKFLNDFLLLARPAPGICEDFDLNEVINDVFDSLRLLPDWCEPLEIIIKLPTDKFMINANKTELRQVVWNISANALQSMPNGGTLILEAKNVLHKGIDSVEIVIKDSGNGIEKKDLQKIFDPFYTTRTVGTGLGLAVVSRIIENWMGTIAVNSEPKQGTTFTVIFPRQVLYCKNSNLR
jgi:two-component system sensor histidine kinase PilS (NtrC family)